MEVSGTAPAGRRSSYPAQAWPGCGLTTQESERRSNGVFGNVRLGPASRCLSAGGVKERGRCGGRECGAVFSMHGTVLHLCWARMVLVPWLFLVRMVSDLVRGCPRF